MGLCQQFCKQTLKIELTSSSSTERTTSQETTPAVAVALEAGVEFGPAAASVSVTASEEQRVGSSLSESLASGTLESEEDTVELSRQEMQEPDTIAVWRWIVTTPMNDGSSANLKSIWYTCTSDANPTSYLPGSTEDRYACRAKPGNATAVQPTQQQQAGQQTQAQMQQSQQYSPSNAAVAQLKSTLLNDEKLHAGSSLQSSNGRFSLTQQTDGNTCLYDGTAALWCNMSNGKGAEYLVMQADGNLCTYTAAVC